MTENPYDPHYEQPSEHGPHSGGYVPPAPPAYGYGYGYGYGYDQVSADANSAATLSLVLGILGIVILPILAPFAIWQANKAEKLGKPATAGKVLGWIGVAFLAIGVLAFLFFLVALIVGASAGY